VSEVIVRPLDEDIYTVGPPGHSRRRILKIAANPIPIVPSRTVPPLVVELIVRSRTREDVEPICSPCRYRWPGLYWPSKAPPDPLASDSPIKRQKPLECGNSPVIWRERQSLLAGGSGLDFIDFIVAIMLGVRIQPRPIGMTADWQMMPDHDRMKGFVYEAFDISRAPPRLRQSAGSPTSTRASRLQAE
jgi:hypothetical protein